MSTSKENSSEEDKKIRIGFGGHVVSFAGLPEDVIVAEILPRLHIKPLYTFKCVSKRYNFIISQPKFGRNYMQAAYSSPESLASSGLFSTFLVPHTNLTQYQIYLSKNVTDLTETINSSDGQYRDNQDPMSISLNSVSLPSNERHIITCSSNGLVVSIFHQGYPDKYLETTLCVYNPLTRQSVKIPHYNETSSTSDCFIATRLNQAVDFLTYRIMAFNYVWRSEPIIIHIFSSDIGRWERWEPSHPDYAKFCYTNKGCISHKGTLYFIYCIRGFIMTYNPYDSPSHFNQIALPFKSFKASLIYSGDEEKLKCCQTVDCEPDAHYTLFRIWKLLDDSEWIMEGEYRVSSFFPKCVGNAVATNPWNQDVNCYPNFVIGGKLMIMDPSTGAWRLIDLLTRNRREVSMVNPLIYVKLCPWSSPFYPQAT